MQKFPRVSRKIALTDRFLRTMKASEGRIEFGDASCRGLSIRCTAAGVKTWTFAYKLNGRMRRITLGEYPALGLSEARSQADGRRAQRQAGNDPRATQDAERAAQAKTALTFAELCERYIEHVKAGGKLSWKTDRGYLKRPKAKFGKRPAISITKRELIDFLETIARTSKSSANRTQSTGGPETPASPAQHNPTARCSAQRCRLAKNPPWRKATLACSDHSAERVECGRDGDGRRRGPSIVRPPATPAPVCTLPNHHRRMGGLQRRLRRICDCGCPLSRRGPTTP
jgi:Arm domain-containing DNA-binding protein